jgi:hypothetical protein
MMTMVISGSDGVTFPDSTNQFSGGAFSFKNRIINGDMRIAQRGTTANPTSGGYYTVDRIRIGGTSGVISTIAPVTSQSTNAPSGFINSFLWTNTNAASPLTTTQIVILQHYIEGTNISDFGWGTANAKTVTLSFWVRSSLTGTFGGAIRNYDASRSYPFSYTISSSNTWEQKSITIAGDTSGTWLTDTGIGLDINFGLGVGPDRLGTAGAWDASNKNGATGQVQLVETAGATFYITGVQLEVGSVATPFERRPYGTELALCQRYYYKIQANVAGSLFCIGRNANTTVAFGGVFFPVTMRISPTALEQSGTAADYQIRHGTTSTVCSAVPSFISTSPTGYFEFTVASGLTAGQGCDLRGATTDAYLAWSAEL